MVFCASDEPLMQWHPNRAYGIPSQQEMPNTLNCFWKSVKITTFWTKVDVKQHLISLNHWKTKHSDRFSVVFSDFFRCSKFPGSVSENKWICFGVPLFFRHLHISIRSLLGTTHRLFFFLRGKPVPPTTTGSRNAQTRGFVHLQKLLPQKQDETWIQTVVVSNTSYSQPYLGNFT